MYKTAKELGIQQWELDNLIVVRQCLLDGRIKQFDMNTAAGVNGSESDENKKYECGTVACIGGWVKIFHDAINPESLTEKQADNIARYVMSRAGRLEELYYPFGLHWWEDITHEMGAKAIENFLTTGDAQWGSVVPQEEYES